jgi:BON domain
MSNEDHDDEGENSDGRGATQPKVGRSIPCLLRARACERYIHLGTTAKVKSSFAADLQVSAVAIDVDTANGVVSLTGVVSSADERQRPLQLAQGIEGVTRVEAPNLRFPRTGAGATWEGDTP